MLLMGGHTLENAQSYLDLLGWKLKGIRETIGVMIYDHQLAVCVSTPIESMILELELTWEFWYLPEAIQWHSMNRLELG
jgi:hypothetical protein